MEESAPQQPLLLSQGMKSCLPSREHSHAGSTRTLHPRGLAAGEAGTQTVPSEGAGGMVRTGRPVGTSHGGKLLPWKFPLNLLKTRVEFLGQV